MKKFLKFILPLILATQMTARAGGIEIRSRGQGAGWVHLRDDGVIPAQSDPAATGLTSRALASADFDEDGVADLVTGYASSGTGGTLSIQRGNGDAIYPNTPEAQARRERGEFTAAAFLPGSKSFSVPEAADFVGAGDFDADGHWDIVAARNGGDKLYWFRGDGHGGFAALKIIYLPGAITSLVAGEMNRADGLTDVVIGIVTQDGPRVLIFESPEGALRGAPESFPLPAPANALALGQLDEDTTPDLAVASGNEVIIIHGRDRKLSLDEEQRAEVKPAAVSRIQLASAVLSIVVGDFVGDPGQKLAVLTADGRIRVLERDGREAMTPGLATGTGDSPSPTRLVTAKISSSPKDDLLVFGRTNSVRIVTTVAVGSTRVGENLTSAGAAQMSFATSLTSDSEVTAVLPMRLNADALQDLVMVSATGVAPSIVVTQAAATYVVNIDGVTNDKTLGDGICADANGNCSFNAALQEADAHPGADTITFNIPGGGVHTISHGFGQYSNEAVTIDGTTQPGGRVEIVANGDYPIVFYGGNSVLRGVAVYGSSTAIILPSNGNIIEGNYIGFRADGTKPVGYGSNGSGIFFQGGVNGSLHGGNNLIGGTTAQARNVISNCAAAVDLNGGLDGNVLQGNYIGTNIAGTAALPNNSVIRTASAYDATIGGTTAGAGNLISGNGGANPAIYTQGSAIVQGNLIGTTADGTQPLANGSYGIQVGGDGTKTITIGGTTTAARNVISANYQGIQVDTTAQIQGNFIGTDADGARPLPNLGTGISLDGGNSVVGGTASGAGNLISGNGDNGVRVGGYYAYQGNNNLIQGNLIGTDVTGTLALPNYRSGIQVYGPTGGHVIGGSSVGARNVISGNRENGIYFTSGNISSRNRAEGNYIGLNRFGTGGIPNLENGVLLDGDGNVVGGTASGAGNVIAYNAGAGIASTNSRIAGIISANSIFSNTGLGIDRGSDSVTPFASDYDEYPVLTSVVSSGSSTTITGKLRTYTDGQTAVTIQFFSNTALDSSGYGEGETFVGQTTVTQPGYATEVSFTATITPAIAAGRYVAAMAIGPTGANYPNAIGSSEFSAGLPVTAHGQLQFSSATYSVSEGGASATISVKRTGGSDGSISVNYATAGGTATGGASCGSGVDFVNASGTLTFANGVTEQSFIVPICQDTIVEPNETVSLSLSNPTGGVTVSQGSATLTIIDDDAPSPTPTPSVSPTPTASPTSSATPTPTATPTATPAPSPTPSPSATPSQIFVIAPGSGGDNAPATLQLTGKGFQAGAVFKLTRSGQADIVGMDAVVSNNGTTLRATFDLSAKARGVWSVVVNNPDGGSAILPDAFTIREPHPVLVWVDIMGRFIMRSNRQGTFYINYGNTGEVASQPTLLRVYIPKGLEVTEPPRLPDGSLPNRYSDGTATIMEFIVPEIPAGFATSLPMKLTAAAELAHTNVKLRIWALSAPRLKTVADLQVDPNAQLTSEPVEDSTNRLKMNITLTDGLGSGVIQTEKFVEDAPGPEEPSFEVVQTNTDVSYRTRITLPQSAPAVTALRRSLAGRDSNVVADKSPFVRLYEYIFGAKATFEKSKKLKELIENKKTTLTQAELVECLIQMGLIDRTGDGERLIRLSDSSGALELTSAVLGQVPAETVPAKIVSEFGKGIINASADLAKSQFAFDFANTICGISHGSRIYLDNFKGGCDQIQEGQFRGDSEIQRIAREALLLKAAALCLSCKDKALSAPRTALFTSKSVAAAETDCPTPTATGRDISGTILYSGDPNDKIGGQGTGTSHYITGRQPSSYVILFENKPEVTAPAQDVVITDLLDAARLDLSTFRLGPIRFGNRLVAPPSGLSVWATDVDLRPGKNLIVRIDAKLDKTSGLVTWRFQSIDPATGQPTTDPTAGFLPPNKTSPQGEGSVLFSIDPTPGLVTGAEIRNKARIVFDNNPPIDTPEWINTIDNSAPVSQVLALSATQASSRFRVQWTGTDTGSGVHSYTIYVSENGGPFTTWLQDTTDTSAAYDGRPNASYSFYSVADDNAQNRELLPPSADASTTTLDGQLPNVSTRMRVGTGDNVLIGGFIITGSESKKVLIRGIGPSLSGKVSEALPDPVLELFRGGTSLFRNDNWKDNQQSEIEATTIPPTNNYEAAIVRTLEPGSYTVILSGNGSTGIGVVEIYDLSRGSKSALANLSSRGLVSTNDNVMIAGFIVGGSAGTRTKVLIRAIGPSLGLVGVKGALANPFLELRDGNGNLVDQNDNWQERRAEIEATTIPPSDPLESAIVQTLVPGNYTAIVRGVEKATGIALVEVYNVQ